MGEQWSVFKEMRSKIILTYNFEKEIKQKIFGMRIKLNYDIWYWAVQFCDSYLPSFAETIQYNCICSEL